jgi:magnesium transporter
MAKSTGKESQKAGLAPGTLVHIGRKYVGKSKITVIDYDENNFQEREVKNIAESLPFKAPPTITWMNIEGIHDISLIDEVGKDFDLHPLILEDIVNTLQRPKMEDYDDYVYMVLKMITYENETQELVTEQVSIILGKNYLLSFQEGIEGDVFDPVRERLRTKKGKIRAMGSDYLAYSLIDAIVDSYFPILEKLGEKIEDVEERLVANPERNTLQALHQLKRSIVFLRKSIWPLRELIGKLERRESCLIQETTSVYLRDVYDHTVQIIETIESYRDMLSGMLDIYLSSISNRTNEVMKVLTIIATIFIPITFLVGLYGMNFKYMPEIAWKWSYPIVWGIIILSCLAMIYYFKRKKWF